MDPLKALPPLEEWLNHHRDEITEIIEFSKCHLDPAPEQLNEAGADINSRAALSGYFLSDCEAYLVEAKAHALKAMPDDLGPTAQKIFLEDRTKEIRRLRDNLRVVVRSLRSLSISICSVRKSQR